MKDVQTVQWIGGVDGCSAVDRSDAAAGRVRRDRLPRRGIGLGSDQNASRPRGAGHRRSPRPTACVWACKAFSTPTQAAFFRRLDEAADYLATSRPTAVNLFWALERMKHAAHRIGGASPGEIAAALLAEARTIHEEDRQMCRAIGRYGAALLRDGQGVLTHCNAGGLATSGYGTALAVLFAAAEAGKRLHVYVDETRPLLQGARLTAWELQQRGIDATLICDNMAAEVMRQRRVQAVVTGADRIAANGDAANKIGTYGLAVLAAAHAIPFYIVAPSSTFDRSIRSGQEIPDRTARPARGDARVRPADRPGRGRRLQSGLRRDPGRADHGHRLRARRHPAGQSGVDRGDAFLRGNRAKTRIAVSSRLPIHHACRTWYNTPDVRDLRAHGRRGDSRPGGQSAGVVCRRRPRAVFGDRGEPRRRGNERRSHVSTWKARASKISCTIGWPSCCIRSTSGEWCSRSST